jgi:pyruvate,orthophosphate dikinase
MKGLPVTIRLLDPPLHEFLPRTRTRRRRAGASSTSRSRSSRQRVAMLHELNPMLGHRGCRLAVTYPEILKMQVRAIVEAAIECTKRKVRASPRS